MSDLNLGRAATYLHIFSYGSPPPYYPAPSYGVPPSYGPPAYYPPSTYNPPTYYPPPPPYSYPTPPAPPSPAAPPAPVVPPGPTGVRDGYNTYRPVPPVGNDANAWRLAAMAVRDRPVGSAQGQDKILLNGQDPHTRDMNTDERLGVWLAMQADDRLRYDVDQGVLFMTRPDGTTRPVMGRDQIRALHRISVDHQVYQQWVRQTIATGQVPLLG